MSGKTIVILGGGVGGLVTANELRRLLPQEHRIVLVERNSKHFFAPSFLWLMTGERRPDAVALPRPAGGLDGPAPSRSGAAVGLPLARGTRRQGAAQRAGAVAGQAMRRACQVRRRRRDRLRSVGAW